MDLHPQDKPPLSIKLACVDMSLREPGYCFIQRTGRVTKIDDSYCDRNKKKRDTKFRALELETQALNLLMVDFERRVEIYKPDYIIVEFPCFTQSANAAVYIGMLWGAFRTYFIRDDFVAIEPSALKVWSNSKKGDHKSKVKEVVHSRVPLAPENNNIIDAIGIGLMFFDIVDELRTN